MGARVWRSRNNKRIEKKSGRFTRTGKRETTKEPRSYRLIEGFEESGKTAFKGNV